MKAARVSGRVTLGVLGVNNDPGSWPDGVNNEQEPDLLGVRCDPDPEEPGFLGGVLGAFGSVNWLCDRGGDDGMGSTASEAKTGRKGGGTFRASLDDGCMTGRSTLSTAVSSSSSDDSLEGCPAT